MGLPFQYRRIQRQPWDERLPDGSSALDPYPTIQPYDDEDPKPQPIPWHGVTPPAEPEPKIVQQPPAVDPQIINDAFARSDTATPPQPKTPDVAQTPEPARTPSLSEMPSPPTMVRVDKYKRPEEVVSDTDDLGRNQELLRRVRDYQPQKAHGWRRYLGPILAGWSTGQRATPGSAWGGLGGAIMGAVTGQFKPKLDDERWKARKEAEVSGRIDADYDDQKAQAQLADLQQRPVIRDREQTRKEARDDMLRDQQEWQRRFSERKQDTYEDYVNWRKANGDRRAETAEGLAQLRREYQTFRQQFQTRQQDDKERHEKVIEGQGQRRIDLSKDKGPGVAQLKTRLNQARMAVNRFNDLTRRAVQASSWGDAQGATNSKALTDERDKLEEQIRSLYPDLVGNDDKQKPSVLRKMWSVSQFKSANPRADMKAAQQAAEEEGAVIIP